MTRYGVERFAIRSYHHLLTCCLGGDRFFWLTLAVRLRFEEDGVLGAVLTRRRLELADLTDP
jgi:hypothetical protein